MQKIGTCLWFNKEAEEAAKFYCSVFKNSKLGKKAYYEAVSVKMAGGKIGDVLTIEFELEGNKYFDLNGGTAYKFNEAISLAVYCDTQKEIDYYWEKLTEGGQEVQCGWLKDKFGVSWQDSAGDDGKDPYRPGFS